MIDPRDAARILGVDISNGLGSSIPDPPASTDREPIDPIPDKVAEELAIDSGDRSKDTYRVACACIDCGLTLANFRWVIDQRPDLDGRANARRDDDIGRCYNRALNEWQRKQPPAAPGMVAGAPAGTGTTAGPTPTPAAGPGRFFGRHGLMALNLAAEVMAGVVCGYGRPDERFYTYEDGVWTPGVEPIERETARLLGNRYRSTHAPLVCTLIKYQDTTARISDRPLADLINVPNGMVRWSDGVILPHDPGYLSTVQLPVEYVPGSGCPQFEVFLSEVLPPDLYLPTPDCPHGWVWELIGYCLYSGNPLQVAVLLFGKGRNGKGVFIRVLKQLLGERNLSTVSLHELVENRFRVATLFGKLANLAGDLDSKWLENTAQFKKITGHDGLQGEYKFGATFEFDPWALPLYSANKAFGSPDSSEGWVARWVVVPFPHTFLGREDRELDAKLSSESELRGILARGIAALPSLMARGNFAQPASLVEAKHAFVIASDAVRAWVDEHCEIEFGAWTARLDLYRGYLRSTGSDTSRQLGAREFYNRIEQLQGVTSARRSSARGFNNIRLKPVTLWVAP